MTAAPASALEAELFRALNAIVEPAVRAGCAAPGLVPTGLIVLETIGAKTGLARTVPVLATVYDGCVVVGTVRGSRSAWARNLAANPSARYWIAGREHRGRARVLRPGQPLPSSEGLGTFARLAYDTVLAPATLVGWTFAVIAPE